MARFFIRKENIHDADATIAGQEFEHLRRVLRLTVGDSVTLFDDTGWEYEAVIRSLHADRGELAISRAYQAGRDSPLALTLALGLTKGEKMDFVVEKATELGVASILPFTSSFTVPKLDDRKIANRTERWQKIALSAAKQCGRNRVPEILPLCEFRHMVDVVGASQLKLLFWEKETAQSLRQVHEVNASAAAILVAVGPEGGFSADEAHLAAARDFRLVHLGRRILRAETAAVTALSLAQFLWGDLT
ncbi:MAG TPA: 16S rRNA (uracil(1498)-N(3))-methyltransferase [Candidatus Limnocylindria bacterium]|nr:16S rRNA (uracil(1498)-N(3))-methyltransferase [Candidatus Limnocylindria bacterium]